jgi:hypothetical protein
MSEQQQQEAPIAWDRPETEPCQAGTPGCSVDHRPDADYSCEGW